MAKLTAHSILAEATTSHVRLAERHSKLGSDVSLLHEFVITVGKSALSAEFAVLVIQPELANFGLFLLLVGRFGGYDVVG